MLSGRHYVRGRTLRISLSEAALRPNNFVNGDAQKRSPYCGSNTSDAGYVKC
jgi:hypothetical protein